MAVVGRGEYVHTFVHLQRCMGVGARGSVVSSLPSFSLLVRVGSKAAATQLADGRFREWLLLSYLTRRSSRLHARLSSN